MCYKEFSNIDQTGFARYNELLKFPGSSLTGHLRLSSELHYVIDFSRVVKKERDFASYYELLIFSGSSFTGYLRPSACSSELQSIVVT